MSETKDLGGDVADFVPYIPHEAFCRALPRGQLRLVVNPALARPYVVHRTRVNVLAASVIGIGAVLAMAGHGIAGVALVALGIAANRLVRHQAGKIVVHLALKDSRVYTEVTSNGVMEVRGVSAETPHAGVDPDS